MRHLNQINILLSASFKRCADADRAYEHVMSTHKWKGPSWSYAPWRKAETEQVKSRDELTELTAEWSAAITLQLKKERTQGASS